jgi:O-antigen/teichoic acid export membrane protein
VFHRVRSVLARWQEYVPAEVPAGTASARVVSGSLWSGGGLAATMLLQFLRSMVLARLLPPAAFGTLNLANVFTQFILLFANFGFTSSVIYWRRLSKRDLTTCWWGNLMVDGAATALCCVFAFNGAKFLETPEVKWVIVLLSAQFICVGVGSVHSALMRRQFYFKETALVSIGGAAVTFLSGWFMVAVLHWGVFGLVASMIAGAIVTTVLQLFVIPWLPSGDFSWKVLKEHVDYGRWFLAVNVVNYGNQNIDRALIGTTLNNTQLGYYGYASDLPMTVSTQLSYTLNSVLFPVFAHLQDDLGELRRILLRVMRYNAMITYPLLVGLALTGTEFVRIVYGPTWAPIVGPMRVFCLVGMIRILTNPAHTLCNGVGRPHLPFKWSLIALPANAALLWWSVRNGGLIGVSLAKLFLPVFTLFTLVVEITRVVGMPVRQIGKAALPACICCAAMSTIVLGLKHLPIMAALPAVWFLVIEVIMGAVTYGTAVRVFYPSEYRFVTGLVRKLRSST